MLCTEKLFQIQKHHRKHFVYSRFQLLRHDLHSTWLGKMEFCKTLQLFPSLKECAVIFKDPVAVKQKIIDVAKIFFVHLYGDNLNMSLDELVSSLC